LALPPIQFLVGISHFLDLPPFKRGNSFALIQSPRPEPALGLPFEPDPDEEFRFTVNVVLNPVGRDDLGLLCVLCVLSFLRRYERGDSFFFRRGLLAILVLRYGASGRNQTRREVKAPFFKGLAFTGKVGALCLTACLSV
jgi:hypothetical protein